MAKIGAGKITRFAVLVCLIWTLIVGISYLTSRMNALKVAEDSAVIAARAQFSRDVLYREWNVRHGGVYAPVTDDNLPNPHLNVPERDITTPSGKKLTLINPAYMTRQAHEIAALGGHGQGHITSLDPLRPENEADQWETEALTAFEQGVEEYVGSVTEDGERYVRLMRPLITVDSCLKCHAFQGCETGDIRGGISVKVPLAQYTELAGQSLLTLAIGHSTVWLLGLLGVGLGSVSLIRQIEERERAGSELLKEKDFTETALDAQQDTFFLFDIQSGRALRWNKAFREISGYTDEEIASQRAPEKYYSAEDLELARQTLENVVETGSASVILNLICKDGQRVPTEYNASLINDKDGNPRYTISVGRDITSLRRAETELAAREAYLGSIVRAAPTGIGVVSNRVLSQVNDKLCAMLGYSEEELIGNSALMLYPSREEFEKVGKAKYDQIQQRGTGTIETVWKRKDGRKIDVLLSSTPLDLDDLSRGVTFTVLDITERKRAEEERKAYITLLETLERVDKIIRETPLISDVMEGVLSLMVEIFDCDRAFLLHPCDPLAPSFRIPMEITKPEWPGANQLNIEVPISEPAAALMRECILKRTAVAFGQGCELPIPKDVAEPFSIQTQIAMMLEVKHGKPWMFGMHQCSHARAWADDERHLFTEIGRRLTDGLSSLLFFNRLTESEEKFRSLVESTHDWVWEVSQDGVYTYSSPQIRKILGYEPEEVIGKTPFDLMPVKEAERIGQVFSRLAAERQPIVALENVNLHKDGREVILETSGVPIFNDAGELTGYRGTDRDVTERKKVEDELKSQYEFTSAAVDSLPGLFYVFTMDGRFLRWNRNLERIAGYSGERIRRMHPLEFFHEDDREKVRRAIELVFRKGYTDVDARFVYADGTTRPYNMTGLKTVLNGETCLVGMGTDLTERKLAEDERLNLERQVLRAQKLESLGILAGGIAHDFNNLLMAVLGNVDLAMLDLPLDSPVRKNLNEVVSATQRAASLAKQMLAYSGRGQFVIERINLSKLTREMIDLLEVSVSKKARIDYDLPDEQPIVEGDSAQLQQIVMNLIVNASEAIGNKNGVIRLTTGVRECTTECFANMFPSPALLGQVSPEPGIYCYLEVSDTGVGMDEVTLSRIFDPFYTTKFTGRGLGLAATLGIVRGHRGAIQVKSAPGQGTTFRVLLPMSREQDGPEKKKTESTAAKLTGSGTILLADDDDSVRKIGELMLKRAGFEVITASDGSEAVELYRAHRDRITAVLLDLTMPNLDGREAFSEIRDSNPEAKVLLCSGFNEADATRRFGGDGPAGFIQKPFTFSSLLSKLIEIISEEY